MAGPWKTLRIQGMSVQIWHSPAEMGLAAATEAAGIIRSSVVERGRSRILMATATSQCELVDSLCRVSGIDWESVDVFHLDEYVGIQASHPASFRCWLKEHVEDIVHPARVHYLCGDAVNLREECLRYERLLGEDDIDLALVGIGENGHIAFNDPHVADFEDPLRVKRVRLDERCRMQQVREGHFPSLDSVPSEALTVTCPTVMVARRLIGFVPGRHKAEAVRNAAEGELSERCPASLLFTHPVATLYLDSESASMLTSYSD
ncbi:MAG: glucosamine-6-phosphate deaminase [Acidobacteriota bacterium]